MSSAHEFESLFVACRNIYIYIYILNIHGLMIKLSRPNAELQFDLQLLHKITKIAMKLFIYTSKVKNSQKYRYIHVDPIKMYIKIK